MPRVGRGGGWGGRFGGGAGGRGERVAAPRRRRAAGGAHTRRPGRRSVSPPASFPRSLGRGGGGGEGGGGGAKRKQGGRGEGFGGLTGRAAQWPHTWVRAFRTRPAPRGAAATPPQARGSRATPERGRRFLRGGAVGAAAALLGLAAPRTTRHTPVGWRLAPRPPLRVRVKPVVGGGGVQPRVRGFPGGCPARGEGGGGGWVMVKVHRAGGTSLGFITLFRV